MKKYQKTKCKFLREFTFMHFITVVLFLTTTGFVNDESTFLQEKNNKLTINKRQSTLSEVVREIEKQSEYSFFINDNLINMNTKVSIEVQNADITKTLDVLLKNTNYTYRIHDRQIAIINAEKAQNSDRKITGTIVDESGEAMIGVNVTIKGTSIGTISDTDGKFTITLPAGKEVLVVSYIGYKEEEIPVRNKSTLNIVLKEDSKMLGEVVITAMGIERKAESLTYATQTVGGNELTRAKETNLINSLQGKSAGLVITPNAGGAGSASKILLRGNASILGNNSPLIVVDGVPMSNNISGAVGVEGGTSIGYSGSFEGSDALSQLNPDDIASITVLKGANSAALYGSAASNGVIMITTKKGQKGSMRIDISSSTTFENPLMLPKFQNTFGGNINADGTLVRDSWGAPLASLTDEQLTANGLHLTRTPYDIANFYELGSNFNNTISLSGGTDKVQSYFSYGNTTANGIYPSNNYQRHNVSFRENFSLFSDKLKIDISGNYIYQKVENRHVGGGNFTSTLPSLYIGSRNADLNYYQNNYQEWGTWASEPYKIYQGTGVEGQYEAQETTSTLEGPCQIWPYPVVSESNNPWWNTGMNNSQMVTNKIFGSIALNYQIIPDLNVQVRFKYDRYMEENTSKQYANTRVLKASNSDRGQFNHGTSYTRDIFLDGMLSYNKNINDFRLGVNVGGSYIDSKGDNYNTIQAASSARGPYFKENFSVNYFDFDGLALGSGSGKPTSNWEYGLFATAQLGYKDLANIEASYREDWYRAFTQFKQFGMKQHYGYYSFGANVLVNRILPMPEMFNQIKVRASYSEVGNSIPNTLLLMSMTKDDSTGGITSGNLLADPNLKPEKTVSTEVGFDLSMFDYAFNMDFTFYNAVMSNQFMTKKGSGGKKLVMNSGKVLNRGVEITASYKLEANRNFSWKTGINFAYNANQIQSVSLQSNGKDYKHEITMSGDGSPIGGGLKIKFIKGGSYGDLYASDFQRNVVTGDITINKDGVPQYNTTKADEYLGNLNSKFHLGWNNTFTYKDFTFYFLIDGKIGGKVISFTEAFMDQKGVSERSGKAREEATANNIYFKEGIPGMKLMDGEKEYMVSVQGYYQAIGGNCGREYVYDATNFRLREVSAGYTFRNLFGPSKSLTLSVNARNLFFLYKNAPVDPDVSLSATNALSGIDLFNLPTTRSYGFSIKATF